MVRSLSAIWYSPTRFVAGPVLALLGGLACAGDHGSNLQVSLLASPLVAPSEVVIHLSDRAGQRTLTGADFTAAGGETLHSASFGVATGGELQIDVILVKPGPDTVGVGTLRIPLQADMRYGVDVLVATSNPAAACIGCAAMAFPLRGSLVGAADSLVIIWGGTSPGAIT